MKTFNPVMAVAVIATMLTSLAMAKTPDNLPPANEGVCDELMEATPGLYGLCVAFCEAQDCEASIDPLSGAVTYAPSCKPSSDKLLANYNKRARPDDPAMPCINEAEDQCLCWTQSELMGVGDGQTLLCGQTAPEEWQITGTGNTPSDLESALAAGSSCSYVIFENGANTINRMFNYTPEQRSVCQTSIAAECSARGF